VAASVCCYVRGGSCGIFIPISVTPVLHHHVQTFGCTVKKPELEAHCESKHPKHGFEVAFPDYDKTLAILKTPKNAPKSAEEKKTKKKRNGYAKRIG
jgi:hypothetical protein